MYILFTELSRISWCDIIIAYGRFRTKGGTGRCGRAARILRPDLSLSLTVGQPVSGRVRKGHGPQLPQSIHSSWTPNR